jgi:small GTP-binding protein
MKMYEGCLSGRGEKKTIMDGHKIISMNEIRLIKKKICLLGSFAVGKTSLIERFVYSRFDEKYLTTIGVKISQKILPPIHSPESGQFIQYNFLIWDIAAMEKFDNVVMNYYRGASGALAVVDLTRPETIPELEIICDKFLSVNHKARLLIIGNKLDIFQENDRTINSLKKTASDLSTEYLLTSAKTGAYVEEAFLGLAKKIGSQ